MNEAYYFVNLQLLVRADYNKKTNTISYQTHRKMSSDEKVMLEHYILTTFARTTQYYQTSPSTLSYLGTNIELKKDMKLLKLKKILKVMAIHDKQITEKVSELISDSMSNYYFERIGDTILEMRKKIETDQIDKLLEIERAKSDIEELLKAYNNYTGKEISIEKVVPKDLMEYLKHQVNFNQL
ncbi:MAG TPA: hypothetical protein ENN22_05360 [bacterium]|nr:hypothetical protein [bacterium]